MAAQHYTPGPGEPADGWLTPTAAAIAGFTFAVLSLVNGSWFLGVQTFITRNGSAAFEDVTMAEGFVQGIVAAAGLVLARRGVSSAAPTARHLGGAGVVVAALGLLVAVLTIVSGLIAAV